MIGCHPWIGCAQELLWFCSFFSWTGVVVSCLLARFFVAPAQETRSATVTPRPYVGDHVGVACVGVLGQVLVPQPPSRGRSAAVTGVQVSRAVAGPFGQHCPFGGTPCRGMGSRPEHGDLFGADRLPRHQDAAERACAAH